uniref:Uncharacterized protein n=1 Tax=Siphoviridae sp. ctqSm5 TaxID=2827949 RepID=A0A8S5SP20_9CAUD|nr:MAG TPA: hypothetical protein [Siphoviridae sp. ctqSm5]
MCKVYYMQPKFNLCKKLKNFKSLVYFYQPTSI